MDTRARGGGRCFLLFCTHSRHSKVSQPVSARVGVHSYPSVGVRNLPWFARPGSHRSRAVTSGCQPKKSPTFFPARGMAELVPPVPPPLPPSPRRCPGRPVGQAGRERLPRASRPAPAPPVSPRWCWGLMARTGCCQMANVGNGQGQGGAGARVPSCRAGKRPIVLRKQGKAVPAMILRAIGLQGSWPLHRVTHTATELHC